MQCEIGESSRSGASRWIGVKERVDPIDFGCGAAPGLIMDLRVYPPNNSQQAFVPVILLDHEILILDAMDETFDQKG
jgi:hypothetical protein